jgi:hypothetical protein
VTCIPITRQRLGKHIPAGAKARESRTYIARQRCGIHASSTIQTVFCVWSVPRVIKRHRRRDREQSSQEVKILVPGLQPAGIRVESSELEATE